MTGQILPHVSWCASWGQRERIQRNGLLFGSGTLESSRGPLDKLVRVYGVRLFVEPCGEDAQPANVPCYRHQGLCLLASHRRTVDMSRSVHQVSLVSFFTDLVLRVTMCGVSEMRYDTTFATKDVMRGASVRTEGESAGCNK